MLRDQFLRDAILSRKLLMLVDDNLDWDGVTSREHQLLIANKHSGVHVLNRQAMMMARPAHEGFDDLSEEFRPVRVIHPDDVIELDTTEEAAMISIAKVLLRQAATHRDAMQEVTVPEGVPADDGRRSSVWCAEAYRKFHAKEVLTPTERMYVDNTTSCAPAPSPPGIPPTTADPPRKKKKKEQARTETPTRLEQNRMELGAEVVTNVAWVVAENPELTLPSVDVAAETTIVIEEAYETFCLVSTEEVDMPFFVLDYLVHGEVKAAFMYDAPAVDDDRGQFDPARFPSYDDREPPPEWQAPPEPPDPGATSSKKAASKLHSPPAALKPKSLQNVSILDTHDGLASSHQDVEKSANDFVDKVDAAHAGLSAAQREQSADSVEHIARTCDGQPAKLLLDAEVRERKATARLKEELEEVITDFLASGCNEDDVTEAFVVAQKKLADLAEQEKRGPRVLQFLGHMHTGQNMMQTLHTTYKLSYFAKQLGYKDQKLVNLINLAKGYIPQNRAFFTQLCNSGLLEAHRWICSKTETQFDFVDEYSEWMAAAYERAETRATFRWWLDFLTKACIPLLGLFASVRHDMDTDEENAALETAALKTFLDIWFAMNHHTYYAIVSGYLVRLEMLSAKWKAIHAANIGFNINGPGFTAWDQYIEMLTNRFAKQMKPSVKSTEDAVRTTDSLELHAVLLEVMKMQAGAERNEDAATPPSARQWPNNMSCLQAVWKARLFDAPGRWGLELEHSLPVTVFEPTQLSMQAGSEELQLLAAVRKKDYFDSFLLSTAHGGQCEVSAMESVRVKIRYQKMKLLPRSTNDLTPKQLEKKVKGLERAMKEQAMLKKDIRGPHQLTNYCFQGKSFLSMYLKSGGVQKALYRQNVMACLPERLTLFLGSRKERTRMVSRSARLEIEVPFEQLSNVLEYDEAGPQSASVVVHDAMFALHTMKAPIILNGKPVIVGGQLIAVFVQNQAWADHITGFVVTDLCLDPQSPLPKQALEKSRDATAAAAAPAEVQVDLTISRDGLLPKSVMGSKSINMPKITTDRGIGRESFFTLMAELVRDEDWVRANLKFPRGHTVIVRGASRSMLGESVMLKADSTGKISVTTCQHEPVLLQPCKHEEADTMVVCVALLHARHNPGTVVLIDAPDNDTVMAGLCGLSSALEAGLGNNAERQAVRNIHLQCSRWWVSKTDDSRRKLPNTASAADKVDRAKSEVIAIGQIAEAICYTDDTALNFLPQGASRALTVAYASGLFGGDTVERIHGYTPASGLAALLFMQEHIGVLPADNLFGAAASSEGTVRRACQLVKASVFLKHKTCFSPPSAVTAAEWLAGQAHEEVAIKLYGKDRTAKNQMLSEDQIAVQCSKMDVRLREWASAHLPCPGLISEPKGPDGWRRHPHQLVGLAPYDQDGNLINGAVAITPANAGPRYGEGPDTDSFAIRLGTIVLEGQANFLLTDEEVSGLREDPENLANDQLVKLGYLRIKANVLDRDAAARPTSSAAGAAAVLRYMVRQAAAPAPGEVPEGEPANGGTAQLAPPATPMSVVT